MQTKHLCAVAALVTIFIFAGCDKDTPAPLPGAVTLTSPANNEACLDGSSSVTFSWNAASDAESYRLTIKNLNTQDSVSYNSVNESYVIGLSANAPYSWYVTAINTAGETASEVWMFYLSGTGLSNFAPYPATLSSPSNGEVIRANGASTVQVTFRWSGSDVDSDISGYSLYIDNVDASTQVIAFQTDNTATQILESGKTYYWKVITTDEAGNTSASIVSSFQIVL